MLHFALFDESSHRADRLFDGHLRIHAMQVIQVDVIDLQTLKRLIARGAHVLRCSIDAPAGSILLRHEPELRGEDHAGPTSGERLADLELRSAVAVRGVEMRDAEVERAVDQINAGVVVACAARVDIANADAHAAETDREN